MTNNNDTPASESSSSNPIPPPVEGSPRPANPRSRGSPPQNPVELPLFTQTPPRTPPTMGAPGRTAFGAYRAPPPPPPQQWPYPGSSHGLGGSRGFGAHAIPVGGGGGGSGSGGGGIRIGGGLAARKRNRDGGAGGGARNPDGAGDGYHYCSVCNKGFSSTKALFGHMRSHPDRGWKGVHPPPTFRAEEEFADLHMAGDEEAAAEDAGEEEGNFRVPDLNQPPPEDSN
ncbi:translation initiation factor IF-2-like [Salvia hispanica]|uniref:translation initiation factor IF-2-like n=1 Tax=Salvia hispanica TaxID=49212 RepID=UPI002009C9E1|nr:translation initiation factor IF-2-like [Salvia hispanica]